MTIEEVKNNGWLIFETIVGSKAYGLNTANSDTDIRGVYVLPKHLYYSLDYTPQVNNETNDIVYYELKRFIELLQNNNPNMLELLAIPNECVLYRHRIFDMLHIDMFLSKQCEKSFANYAFTQIKKASGLEKKIMNPIEKERKTVLDFCSVAIHSNSYSLIEYLVKFNVSEANCGLAKINHFRDCYFLFHSEQSKYYGIIKNDDSNEVHTSSIKKGEEAKAILFFNRDAYSIYCKNYREYWDWVDKRNEERYKGTMAHGKKYDAKNMMHVFRLLNMAVEIAKENKVNVFRKDRDFLLSIKSGAFEYDDLVGKANEIKDSLEQLFKQSNLKEAPNYDYINNVLVDMRSKFYGDLM